MSETKRQVKPVYQIYLASYPKFKSGESLRAAINGSPACLI